MKTSSVLGPFDSKFAVPEPWRCTKKSHLRPKWPGTQRTHKNTTEYHAVVLNFPDFWCHLSREPLDGKTWFQAHIVEQLKNY